MYRPLTSRRLNVGDSVRLVRDASAGICTILDVWQSLSVESYMVSMVTVRTLDGIEKQIPLSDCIKDSQVALYESLEPGDLIVYGKRKRAHALVLDNRLKRFKRGITLRVVSVLEDGIKHDLSIRQEIIQVRRARDVEDVNA